MKAGRTGRMEGAAAWMAVLALAAAARGGDIGITVYNARFACVKEARVLELEEGENALRLTDMPGELEADSVVLRETGDEPFGVEVLEQRYVNEPLTEEIWLREMEGREVRFRRDGPGGTEKVERGTVIRGGRGKDMEPMVGTADGVRFSMPGQPVFDGLDAAAYLKPSLEWVLRSGKAGRCPVEAAYLTGGLSWEATYNLVAAEGRGDEYAMDGWVSIRNDSGKDYPAAAIKLLAGDVHRVERLRVEQWDPPDCDMFELEEPTAFRPEERRFDEFHLYTMPRRATLKNGELKQIQFLRAEGVRGEREYVYEPLRGLWRGYNSFKREEGLNGEKKVAVHLVVSNSETNGLGVPLPKGTVRLYRRDAKDGRAEFTGESFIDHTPKDEVVRLDVGYAFDLAAERTQTDFEVHSGTGQAVERFEIKVRNHKATVVQVRVVEHLWRCATWEITEESAPHEKTAADRAEWVVEVPADGEAAVTYSVLYSWM